MRRPDGEQHPETTGSALLDIAQRTLSEALLPHLDPDRRYIGLMVASAMRMVAREIEQAPALDRSRHAMRGFVGEGTAAVEASADSGERDRSLVEAIRSGRLDADQRLHALIWADASLRVSIARPSLLTRVERRLANCPEEAQAAPNG